MATRLDYDGVGNGLWGIFARVKYWAAQRAPREPGERPAELRLAAEMFRDSLEKCWRAGYKGEDLVKELKEVTRTPILTRKES